ncbi:MAG: WhiB family transcriptional regulator [Streptomyces sp.]|nr:WhiB family transcriptional regulator [Streptomyces sp.]
MTLASTYGLSTPRAEAWTVQALCADSSYEDIRDDLWFAPTSRKDAVDEARFICHQCPVRDACLTDALTIEGAAHRSERHGIRGGLTGAQRRRRYEKTLQGPKRPPAKCGTRSGYQKHRKDNTEPCEDCRWANTAYHQRRSVGPPKVSRQPAPCGTRGGYRRHRSNGEAACDACRQANTDSDNRLRRTGTTRIAA